MRAYSGMVILNDALPSGNSNGQNHELWRGRDRFGIEADDVTFVGYWQRDTGIACSSDGFYVSAWRRPGKVLLAVVNTGDAATARVQLDPAKLGLPAASQCAAVDAETSQTLAVQPDGSVDVPINRHDYRQIIVQGNGFFRRVGQGRRPDPP